MLVDFSMMLLSAMPSVFSAWFSMGRPWQSQPQTRGTELPRMVQYRAIMSLIKLTSTVPWWGLPVGKGGPS